MNFGRIWFSSTGVEVVPFIISSRFVRAGFGRPLIRAGMIIVTSSGITPGSSLLVVLCDILYCNFTVSGCAEKLDDG